MILTRIENTTEAYKELSQSGFEKFFVSSWKGWDQLGTIVFYFYDCVLNVDLPGYPKGTEIDGITLDLEANIIEFDIKQDVVLSFTFKPSGIILE